MNVVNTSLLQLVVQAGDDVCDITQVARPFLLHKDQECTSDQAWQRQ